MPWLLTLLVEASGLAIEESSTNDNAVGLSRPGFRRKDVALVAPTTADEGRWAGEGASTDGGTSTEEGISTDEGSWFDRGTSIDEGTSTIEGAGSDEGTPTDAGTSTEEGTSTREGGSGGVRFPFLTPTLHRQTKRARTRRRPRTRSEWWFVKSCQ